jgi:hypothetical protein
LWQNDLKAFKLSCDNNLAKAFFLFGCGASALGAGRLKKPLMVLPEVVLPFKKLGGYEKFDSIGSRPVVLKIIPGNKL